MKNELFILQSLTLASIIFVLSFLGNVYLHEFGHYAAADLLGLHPEIYMEPVTKDTFSLTLQSESLAYTEFDNTSSKKELIFVAIVGPLVNLLLTLIFLIIYLDYKHKPQIQVFAIAGLIPSILSFVINVLPYATTDGMMIVRALF